MAEPIAPLVKLPSGFRLKAMAVRRNQDRNTEADVALLNGQPEPLFVDPAVVNTAEGRKRWIEGALAEGMTVDASELNTGLMSLVDPLAAALARVDGRRDPAKTPVATLTPDLVPVPFRSWLSDIATLSSAPLEFVVCPALVAVGAVIGGAAVIRPDRWSDYSIVPNTWGAIVAPSGFMKSPMLEAGTAPLQVLQGQAFREHEAEQDQSAGRRRALGAQIKGTEAAIEALSRKGDVGKVAGLQTRLEELLAEQQEL
jgi:hypothetical protein